MLRIQTDASDLFLVELWVVSEANSFWCFVGEIRLADFSFPSGSSQQIPALVLRVVNAKGSYLE